MSILDKIFKKFPKQLGSFLLFCCMLQIWHWLGTWSLDHVCLMLVGFCKRFQIWGHILSEPFFCFRWAWMKPMMTMRIPWSATCRSTGWTKKPWTRGKRKGLKLLPTIVMRITGISRITGIRVTCIPWIACYRITITVIKSTHFPSIFSLKYIS